MGDDNLKFDAALITTRETEFEGKLAVHYDTEYAGAIRPIEGGEGRLEGLFVSKLDGALMRITTGNDPDTVAAAVANQFWLVHKLPSN